MLILSGVVRSPPSPREEGALEEELSAGIKADKSYMIGPKRVLPADQETFGQVILESVPSRD